eukprot:symbB.v1.2.011786.t1/scaffold798.1/size257095/7
MADAPEAPPEVSRRDEAELQRQQLRRRVDSAVKTMMEGYIATVEAAKASSESDRAVNHYVQCCYTAAMARASEELIRLAGELSVAKAVAAPERLEGLRQNRKMFEKKVNDHDPSRMPWLLSSEDPLECT